MCAYRHSIYTSGGSKIRWTRGEAIPKINFLGVTVSLWKMLQIRSILLLCQPLMNPRHVSSGTVARKVDVRLPGKGNSESHGARPVHLIITILMWIRASRLSMMNSLPGVLCVSLPPRRLQVSLTRVVAFCRPATHTSLSWDLSGRGTTRAEDAQQTPTQRCGVPGRRSRGPASFRPLMDWPRARRV